MDLVCDRVDAGREGRVERDPAGALRGQRAVGRRVAERGIGQVGDEHVDLAVPVVERGGVAECEQT